MDALRAGALLLGIVLHSLLPFVPELPWLIEDARKTELAWPVVFWIHLFRMALFMMLAGYFGRLVLLRRGTRSYLRDRLVRIGLPFVAFWPFAVGTLGLLVYLGATWRGVTLPQAPPPPEGTPAALAAFPPGQLWFLVVLLQLVLVTVVVRAIALALFGPARATRWAGAVGAVLARPAGLLLAALPYALALVVQGTAIGGIIAPPTVLPEPVSLLAYGGAFAVGWFLQANDGAIDRAGRRWGALLAVATALSVAAFVFASAPVDQVWPAVLTGLAAWAWIYALLGVAARVITRPVPWIRYLADASYWMYLVHLPLLVAIAIPLADLPWPIVVKLLLTWVVATVVMLLSYDLMVRSTWIGAWLNGRRSPRVVRRAPDRSSSARS
ncbi:hypothetical protein KILIM_037_00160 [Kineosphaera limosa NBRC 100340]|uniref:Acyltransferase 3 domain-containing protein n=1 Tax=Kineosphaera limosa NBRC 100340 TaxID=1184609 RepID=K6WWD7_9MICO|nr:hypothetical protein KILIM_037_00160 [Kineosphaera limosa NBRC 100340]